MINFTKDDMYHNSSCFFSFVNQEGIHDDMEDNDLYKEIPTDWWLSPDSKACLLLTRVVHRKNKEITPLCTGHKRGNCEKQLDRQS